MNGIQEFQQVPWIPIIIIDSSTVKIIKTTIITSCFGREEGRWIGFGRWLRIRLPRVTKVAEQT